MALLKDKGLCIKTLDYSETSQILTFFTYESGKVSVIAKGSRRPKSSFAGPIEICSVGQMVYSVKEGERLGTLTEFNQTCFPATIRKKILALNCSFFAAELLNLFTREGDSQPALFDEAISFLKRLDEEPDEKAGSNLIAFQFALLISVGSLPVTDRCSNCKRNFANDWQQYYFSASAGGLICRDCEGAFVDKKVMTFEAANCLNKHGKDICVKSASLVQTEEILVEYITYVLEKRPRAAQMVLQLLRH